MSYSPTRNRGEPD